MNEYVLIGFRVYKDKKTNEDKGFTLFFSQLQKNNSVNEFGTVVKCLYAFRNQIGCTLNVGESYYLFTSYDSGTKQERFAGLMPVGGVKK